ncbi:uncharacterized protein SPPG_01188 [Spizellomyces punctatus DAOM BR117]|uniref:Carboxypeptidase n=1 Tax=Spizellomyces punctatus (strain DAOM BR117) TaxID=645134 RepID=A0A0L0HSA2_SPIPD|nr:uncharacterized protein SPPG_01188 [Spizellomyces punctatus DAOM BR117]KND03729.1 hypothetical protein SPPG_01188 [Spizellomyces punctatus DAOM BR117]|eukprot:XP_016611768.1 hypothetical protein SPPG_01188 [Spizellomyces punctatus DAOM BR117]
MIGLFDELGPMRVKKGKLERNTQTWNKDYSILFIDNPVGTGFSYVTPRDENFAHKDRASEEPRDKSDENSPLYVNGYAANEAAVSRDLCTFLLKFYEIFPEQLESSLFLTGESYAGKYVPHFASAIHTFNRLSEHPTKIPLKGIAIGDGLTDPVTQIKYHAPLALAVGLVNKLQATRITQYADAAIDHVGRQEWTEAGEARKAMFEYFANVTGGINVYDVRQGDVPKSHQGLDAFLSRTDVRKAINVCGGHLQRKSCDGDPRRDPGFYHSDPAVAFHLAHDIMRSAAPQVAELLNSGYHVLLYQAQFDFRDGVLGQTEWIENLDWEDREGYIKADRQIWKVDGHVAGYVTKYQQLKRVEILLAGHFAPQDQKKQVRQMINTFVEDAERNSVLPAM